jgi:hypothetical protein
MDSAQGRSVTASQQRALDTYSNETPTELQGRPKNVAGGSANAQPPVLGRGFVRGGRARGRASFRGRA